MVGKREIQKDTLQVIAESAATHVGRIATIVTGAVREVTHEFGEWASDVFEMREAANSARRADARSSDRGAKGDRADRGDGGDRGDVGAVIDADSDDEDDVAAI